MIMIMIMIYDYLYIYKVLKIVCDCTVLHKTLDSFGNCLKKKNVEIINTSIYTKSYPPL